MITWVKFYTTGVAEYQTYYIEEKTLQNDGETHSFSDAQDAQSKSTVEVFIFWDGQPVGAGTQTA